MMTAIPSLPALSIRQPWASSIVHGGKDVENRSWPTKFRGRFLIHASKGMTGDDMAGWRELTEDRGIKVHVCAALRAHGLVKFSDLPRGGIVGEAELVDCVQYFESPWFVGEWGFVLRNVKALPFTPCKGALGFFSPILGVEQVAPSDSTPPKPRAEVTQAQLF